MNAWQGETVAILASGESMSKARCDLLKPFHDAKKLRAIVINHTHRLAPWADVLYACDGAWWTYHHKEVRKTFGGQLWTQDAVAAKNFGLYFIASARGAGLSRSPGKIFQGGGLDEPGHSGYQAINLAFLWGVSKMILVGFDMLGGHWHQPHHINVKPRFETWKREFTPAALQLKEYGIDVFNVEPSALNAFPKMSLQEAIDACALSHS